MLNLDEDALVCDLAETYNIYDYRQLPLMKVAVFAYGLSDNSRIKSKMNNMEYSMENVLLIGILDRLSQLLYMLAGAKNPELLTEKLINNDNNKYGFKSSKDFEMERKRLINQMQEGGSQCL